MLLSLSIKVFEFEFSLCLSLSLSFTKVAEWSVFWQWSLTGKRRKRSVFGSPLFLRMMGKESGQHQVYFYSGRAGVWDSSGELFDWIDDHLYSTVLRSLEQTHCACLWFYMSDKLFIVFFIFYIHRSGVLKRWHGWCHMKLQLSQRKFCVHHITMHHVTCKATYVRCMRV